ncbi:hypothetical protein [Mangrovibacter yixingensis]|nr:hypothetical protein [Mangrovibacter yixingensis]
MITICAVARLKLGGYKTSQHGGDDLCGNPVATNVATMLTRFTYFL